MGRTESGCCQPEALRRAALTAALVLTIPWSAHAALLDLSINTAFSVATEFTADGPEGLVFINGATDVDDRLLAPHGNDCSDCTLEVYDTSGVSMGSIATSWDEIRGIDLLPNGNLVISSLNSESGTLNILPNAFGVPAGPLATTVRTRRVVEITPAGATVAGGINLNLTNKLDGSPPDAIVSLSGIEVLHLVDELESVLAIDGSTLFVGEEGPDPVDPDSRIIRTEVQPGNVTFTFPFEFPAGPEPFDDVSGMDFDPLTNRIFSVDDTNGGQSAMFLWELDGTQVAMSSSIFSTLTDGLGACPAGGCKDPEGVAFDSDSGIVWVAFENDRAIIGFNVAVVPEPTTGLLLMLGAGLAVARRRI